MGQRELRWVRIGKDRPHQLRVGAFVFDQQHPDRFTFHCYESGTDALLESTIGYRNHQPAGTEPHLYIGRNAWQQELKVPDGDGARVSSPAAMHKWRSLHGCFKAAVRLDIPAGEETRAP